MRTLVLALFLALPVRAAAAPACPAQKQALAAWLGLAAADRDRGAFLASDTTNLPAIPLRKGAGPRNAAMTLIVNKDGVRDGARLVAPEDVRSLIDGNVNLQFLRQNPNAAPRGILVAAEDGAPSVVVRDTVLAALATKEQVWLVFRPADKRITQPPDSSVTKTLAALDRTDINGFVELLTRELGRCPALMTMLQRMGGQDGAARLDALITVPPGALASCKCKPPGATVASILWTLAFRDLGVLVEVKGKAEALPWGDGIWVESAPAVVKALE